ncbi:MAG: tRNA-(ms[2]io[6]A)-hydroxylase [Pseudomonadales bacterium]
MLNIKEFLNCESPDTWVECAADNLPLLLMDHANCEKKAASTALNLMYRYVDKPALMMQLSKLAREELRHFEQVLGIISARQIDCVHVSPSRYAGELRKTVRTHEPARLIDVLIVSAIVEARSCERFGRLVGVLDDELATFYRSLMKSEARHFRVYLELARALAADIEPRIEHFLAIDEMLITTPDPDFRFHSGVPT